MKDLLSKFQHFETPFYFYDMGLLRKTLSSLKSANKYGYHVHYALKANVNARILYEIKAASLGVDCVSGNEVKLAVEHGFNPQHIVLAGVGKTDKEILYALNQNIFSFNVESIQELEVINQLAGSLGKRASISVRINPEVDAGTHRYITTGSKENKFGISVPLLLERSEWIKSLENIEFLGLHFHIGSQITDLDKFRILAEKVNDIQKELRSRSIAIPHLNVGGGLGVNYLEPDRHSIPDFETYFSIFNQNLQVIPGQEVHFELGRSIVAQCGHLISRVIFVKESGSSQFVILDAGMTELMRPALYQAVHKIENLSSSAGEATYDVVGPICESSDSFVKGVILPVTKRGDLMAIRTAGAYGETMRNNYNARSFAEAYYSDDLV